MSDRSAFSPVSVTETLAAIAGYDERSVAIVAGVVVGSLVLIWLLLKIWKLLVGIVVLVIIAVGAKIFFAWLGTQI